MYSECSEPATPKGQRWDEEHVSIKNAFESVQEHYDEYERCRGRKDLKLLEKSVSDLLEVVRNASVDSRGPSYLTPETTRPPQRRAAKSPPEAGSQTSRKSDNNSEVLPGRTDHQESTADSVTGGPKLSGTRPDMHLLCWQHKTKGKKFIVGGHYDSAKCRGWTGDNKQCSRKPK